MKKPLKIAAALLGLFTLAAVAFLAFALHTVGTPEFKDALLKQARERWGVDVSAKQLEVSVLEGIRLEGVRVANPAGFAGELMSADAFVLRYRLWPLLRGRVELSQLSLRKPVARIVGDARGRYNYEVLGSRAASTPAATPGAAPGQGAAALVRELVISRLAMDGGSLSLLDGRSAFLDAKDVDFQSSLALVGTTSEGKGEASVGTLALGDALFLRGVSAPLLLATESLRLGPVKARLAGGDVTGDIRFVLKPSLRYTMKLDVDGASVKTLLEEARSAPTMTGRLAAHASLAGTAGLPTVKGSGTAEVRDCALTHAPVMKALALALQLPELADPRFESCRAEFTVAGAQARTPVVALKGPALQLTGAGVYNLQTAGLDYDMTLLLPQAVYRKVTAKAVRGAFEEGEDGSASIDFRVTGTSSSPRVDLAARVAKAAAVEAAKGGLSRLFGKKKRRE